MGQLRFRVPLRKTTPRSAALSELPSPFLNAESSPNRTGRDPVLGVAPGLGRPAEIRGQKSLQHSTVPASRRTALLLGHICPICSLRAPCPAGAKTVSVLAGLLPRAAIASLLFRDSGAWQAHAARIEPLCYQVCTCSVDSNARLTASGSFAITRRSVAAGPLTRRVPCSHFR